MRIIAAIRFIPLMLVIMLISACASNGTSAIGTQYDKFLSKNAEKNVISIDAIEIDRARLTLTKNTTLKSTPILGTSPFEVTQADKISSLVKLARRINTITSIRHDGYGVKKSFSSKRGKVPGFRLKHELEYKDWKDVAKDFPSVPMKLLMQNGREAGSRIIITKWHMEYYFVLSPDKSAYKAVLASAKYLDHSKNQEEGSESDRSAFFTTLTYRYPVNTTGSLISTSVVFKLFQTENQRVYVSEQQATGWLPLQKNSTDGSYNLYFTLVHASNIRSLMESFGGVEGLMFRLLGVGAL